MVKKIDNKNSLKSYELILTENCNLRCKYCFDDSYSNRTSCNYNYKMELSMVDDIINFIEETRDKNVPFSNITFFGGEPTLNWEFIESFVNKSKDKKYKYAINTNTLLLNKDRINFMLENRIMPIISIDGIKDAHDANRVKINKEGSWEETVKKIPEIVAKFRGINLNPSGLMVVTPNNCEYIEKSYEFLLSMGLNVNILYNYNAVFSEEQYSSIERQLINLFLKKRLPPYGELRERILNNKFYEQKNYCHMPERNVTISPKGDLFFCHRVVPKMNEELYACNKETYGDIYNGYINEEYIEKMKNRTNVDVFSKDKKCNSCPAVSFCKGGCIGAIRNGTGSYDDIMPSLCRIQIMLYNIFLKEMEI